MPSPTQNPRDIYLEGRQRARSKQILYDGSKFPISFDRQTQQRVEKLAAAWRVPRAEMVRYLVASALDAAEAIPIPSSDQKEETK